MKSYSTEYSEPQWDMWDNMLDYLSFFSSLLNIFISWNHHSCFKERGNRNSKEISILIKSLGYCSSWIFRQICNHIIGNTKRMRTTSWYNFTRPLPPRKYHYSPWMETKNILSYGECISQQAHWSTTVINTHTLIEDKETQNKF